MNNTHVCGLRLVVKPDVSWSVEQTLQDRWSLAVLKPFRKKYGWRRCVFVFQNKVTYSFVVFSSAKERPKGLRFMSGPLDLSETKNI